MKTKIVNQEQILCENHDHNLLDDKGRRIGCRVKIWRIDVLSAKDDQLWWNLDLPAGSGHFVNVQSTRNGKDYGASQPQKYFRAREEAERYGIKKVVENRTRIFKKMGIPAMRREGQTIVK